MRVRPAIEGDADTAAEIIRRSITQLCALDYRNDPAVLERWLEHRSAEDVRRWTRAADRKLFVVEAEERQLIGVGLATDAATIALNHVAPEARFRGVSKLLVRHMETHLSALGRTRVTLLSSNVAREFYLALGYSVDGLEESRFGTLPGIRMSKPLLDARVR